VVTPLASLYSLVTIPLAILLLGERIAWREGLGIGLALLAVLTLCREKAAPETCSSPPSPTES
jgi:drug/metabolite transporter (DMT)-like permease